MEGVLALHDTCYCATFMTLERVALQWGTVGALTQVHNGDFFHCGCVHLIFCIALLKCYVIQN